MTTNRMSTLQSEIPDRKYEGEGKVHFSAGENIECTFEILCHQDGRSIVICNVSVSDDFIKILKEQSNKKNHKVSEACLSGKTNDGGDIIIEKLGLNKTTVNTARGTMTRQADGNLVFESTDPSEKGIFVFIPFSNIEISYSELGRDEPVVMCFAIFNFEFVGSEKSRSNNPRLDKFTAVVSGYSLEFMQDIDYKRIISLIPRKVGITSRCLVTISYQKVNDVIKIFKDCVWILSFATSNWIAFPYVDIVNGNSLVRTVIYPITRPFPFITGQQIIGLFNPGSTIKDFLEVSFDNYISLKNEFGLNHIIKYYISAIRQRSIEEEFLTVVTAFECLNSHIIEHAQNNGVVLDSGDVEIKKNIIRKVSNRLKLNLDDNALQEIAVSVAYDKIGIKAGLRFLFNKFSIKYDEAALKILYERRNQVIHTGIVYSGRREDLSVLSNEYNTIVSLLTRTVLTLLGWKGKRFIDRGACFQDVELD
jgi:hypothetical protein